MITLIYNIYGKKSMYLQTNLKEYILIKYYKFYMYKIN